MDWGRRGRDTATGNRQRWKWENTRKQGGHSPQLLADHQDVSRHDRWAYWGIIGYQGESIKGIIVIGCWDIECGVVYHS